MKKTAIIVAAALAIGGFNYCGAVYADSSSNQNSMTGVKDTHSVNSVREQLKEITEAALSKNSLDDIADRLTVVDQKRLSNLNHENSDDLNRLVEDINQKWKQKYNHSFNEKDVALAEPFVVINSINKAQTAGAQSGSNDSNQAEDESHEVANVTIASSNGLPELNLTMLREHISWKLQLPASVDATSLKSNLMAQLQKINSDSSQWPSDENEAYRLVTHRVLMGITGAQGGNAQPAASHGMP